MRISDWSSDVCSSDLSSCAIASRFFAWPGFPLRAGAKHRARTKVKNHSDTIIIGEGKMMKKTYLLISGATLCCVPLANAAQAQTSSGIEQAVPVPQTDRKSTRLNSSH